MVLLAWTVPAAGADEDTKKVGKIWDFENVTVGQMPMVWKVEGTNQRGPLATWKVIEDDSATSGNKVFALTSANHDSDGTFNICRTDEVSLLNGEIQVRFKANTGKEDQGGGVLWRARNKDNYYVARYNPLENNLRIYYVKNGSRKTLGSASIKLPSGQWHRLKIRHRGETMEVYLNGEKLITVKDRTFMEPGGVGLWTKADAVTSFDDFSATPSAQ
jgi:hypothetical protein